MLAVLWQGRPAQLIDQLLWMPSILQDCHLVDTNSRGMGNVTEKIPNQFFMAECVLVKDINLGVEWSGLEC